MNINTKHKTLCSRSPPPPKCPLTSHRPQVNDIAHFVNHCAKGTDVENMLCLPRWYYRLWEDRGGVFGAVRRGAVPPSIRGTEDQLLFLY
ncbi:hypothetical protein T05_338 [Trichinella murrelli]|uniref:Uncharacterized protein n=1 Tax=Trichinella murrelli TaxID=144512 RepID=A0A0V0TW52_9BILA|nr:hypothetical protein T05_338 [Trichinella murrelli]